MEPFNPNPPVVAQSQGKLGQLFGQFLRFGIVGVINTAINFIVLNILSHLTGIKSGPHVVYISLIAFAVALANSYFLNDFWVFKDEGHHEGGRKFSLFLTVSLIGAGINALVVFWVTTHMQPVYHLSQSQWLNVANLVATGVALVWNFIGYKLFVFKN